MRAPLRGYSPVEVTVLLTIVVLLFAILLAALANARSKGQDTDRIAAVLSFKKALDLYNKDHNGVFPTVSNGGEVAIDSPSLVQQITPTYIPTIPSVLASDNDRYYAPDGQHYGLLVFLHALNSYCVTGVGYQGMGWWGSPDVYPYCSF